MSKRLLNNQKGFTLLEIVMALGLSGLVAVAVFGFYTSFSQSLFSLSEEIEVAQDLESGQRIMLRDLKSVDTSFGVVQLLDDNGKQFFEVFPDVGEDELHSSVKVTDPDDPEHPAKRVITLKATGLKEMTILLHDSSAHLISTLNYTPSWAYNMATTPMPTWVHVNQANIIGQLRPPADGRRGFWADGNLLMLDVPAVFRTPAQMSARNQHAPRPPFFVGRVAGTNASAAFPIDAEVQKIVNTAHPITGVQILDANSFLWLLPGVAGGMPTVRLRPVRLVRYYIEEMDPAEKDPKKKGLVRLFRWAYTKGKWDKKVNHFMIAEKLRSVQFRRNSVTEKAVLFDLSRQEL